MKKFFALVLCVISLHVQAQDKLVFNSKFVQSEDKWIAFKADSLGSHTFGFIYIDADAGLTFDYAGSFTVQPDGRFLLKNKSTESSVKHRLQPSNLPVAIIPESHFGELEILKYPEWLKHYKDGEGTPERLYKWGYMYNSWGECAKALEFLEKANSINPDFKGLRVELGFSYNCLKQFTKAIDVLKIAAQRDTKDAYVHKELLYSQIHNNQIDDAVATYEKVMATVPDKTYNAENAINILGGYFRQGKLKEFDDWVKKTKIDRDPKFGQYVQPMRQELTKN
ncbi:tetratricopeptide repeat protein [Flavobacterium selenitireducens]|uniref:tetratricopeptide repeat protein n=1 Tax=Flavobacterium selenitireducens TaxID=2722704 RepID=UPI00168AAB57|nr:hypothetical protein [Flavobacterium selenitireducens]MBD3581984.1 hypothetical protein [Flavobacterium selenitireducens]